MIFQVSPLDDHGLFTWSIFASPWKNVIFCCLAGDQFSKKLSRISFYLSSWLRPSSKLVYKPWKLELHKNLHELVRNYHKPNRSFSHNHGNLARYQTTTPSWFLCVLISITKPAARWALCRNDCPTLRRYHRQCFGCRLGGRTSSKKLGTNGFRITYS